MKPMMRAGIAVLFLALAGGTARAAEITVNDLLARMEQADRKIATVSFDFSQEIGYSLTKEKLVNVGEVVFRKPDKLYLRQKSPLEQVIVSNGKKVWIYTPTYKQALVDTWKKWTQSSLVPSSMLNFSQNYGDLKKNYVFSLEGSEENKYVLLLTPKAKDAWRLKLWVDKESLTPDRAVLFGENITITTRMANYRINPPVDKKLFTFQVPPGVDTLSIP